MIPAQEVVEAGLDAASKAGADGCIVLVDEGSHADVRFALNTTTTNGVHRAREVSVVVIAGDAVATATRAGVVGTDGVDRDGGRRAGGRPPVARRRGRLRPRRRLDRRDQAAAASTRARGDRRLRARRRALVALGCLRARPRPRRRPGRLRRDRRRHLVPRQLHGAAPLARPTHGGGQPGRADRRRQRLGLGGRAQHRPRRSGRWSRRSGAASTGARSRSRSTPAATRSSSRRRAWAT